MFILVAWMHSFVNISNGVATMVYLFCVHNFRFRDHVTTGSTGRTLACCPFVVWLW